MLVISSYNKPSAIGHAINKNEIAALRTQARLDSMADATGESRTVFEKFAQAWEKIAQLFCSLTANETDFARDNLYKMFRADYDFKNATDVITRNQRREEFMAAFNQLKELACDEDKENFKLIYDDKSKKITVAIFSDARIDPATDNAVISEVGAPDAAPLNLLESVNFTLYENESTHIQWAAIKDGFSDANRFAAVEILNQMCNTESISAHFEAFSKLAALAEANSQELFNVTVADLGNANKKVKLTINLAGQSFSSAAMDVDEAAELLVNNVRSDQIEDDSSLETTIHAGRDLIRSVNFVAGFNAADKPAAAKLLNQIWDSQKTVSQKIPVFAKLSELPNSNGAFKINIEDSLHFSAKISGTLGKDVLFQDDCQPGEDCADSLIDCPATLFSNKKPGFSAAKMMFSLGQLSREKFELIFSDTNRPAALKIINDMCRNRRNVNTVNIGALYQLGDKQHLEALFSIFRYQNQQSLINQAIPRLDRMFNLVCSKIGLEGAVKLKAKKGLDNFMHEIFDAGDKYSIDSTNVIKNHLDRSINADQNRGARNIKRAIFNEFFNIKV